MAAREVADAATERQSWGARFSICGSCATAKLEDSAKRVIDETRMVNDNRDETRKKSRIYLEIGKV